MIFGQSWQLEEVPKYWRKANVTAVFFRPVKDKVIRSSQHGFAEGKSCLSNLISFYEEVTSLMDKGRAMDVVFLDFIVAFDAVAHKTFIE